MIFAKFCRNRVESEQSRLTGISGRHGKQSYWVLNHCQNSSGKDRVYSRQWGNIEKCLEGRHIRVEHEGSISEGVHWGIVKSRVGYVGWGHVF